jgi:hypothetical protein
MRVSSVTMPASRAMIAVASLNVDAGGYRPCSALL